LRRALVDQQTPLLINGGCMVTLQVTKYLSPEVKDNKDSLARQTRVQVKEKVASVNGKLVRFEVNTGTIFITVDTESVAEAVTAMFAKVKEPPVVEVQEPLQAIFMQSELRARVAEAKAKAAGGKAA
jgi:hypothetical protein